MRAFRHRNRVAIGALGLGALLLSGCASQLTMRQLADAVPLGAGSDGEPCVANRTWTDAAVPDAFDSAYVITCTGVSASRPVGALRIVAASPEHLAPIEATLVCGDPVALDSRAGKVEGRRCYDSALGAEVVRLDRDLKGQRLIGVATADLMGPLEQGMAVLTGNAGPVKDARAPSESTIDVAALAALPAGAAPTASEAAFDPRVALQQGIGFNHRGLFVEASRLLNDALSRTDRGDPAQRAELELEAGLADSNISFPESANKHFDAAAEIMASEPQANTPLLTRKLAAYRALDLLNRGQYAQALPQLDRLVSSQAGGDQPLLDIATVRQLNQQPAETRDASSAIAVPDQAELSQLVLDGQANWARSYALFALGELDKSGQALDDAERAFEVLQREPIDQSGVLWLGSRIDRQRGRLLAERGDWDAAIAKFDSALRRLRTYVIDSAGTGTEPSLAEVQLERASVIARSNRSYEEKRREYSGAIDALVAAGPNSGVLPIGLEGYFDLLISEAENAPRADTKDRFFRALQVAGEPATARQFNELQNVVTSDPTLARKMRQRDEYEREITRLRYAIAAGGVDAAQLAEMEQQRDAAEAQLIALRSDLAENSRFRSVDDQPATLAEVQAALQPGEGFLKIAEMNRRVFGIYITKGDAFIYKVVEGRDEVRELQRLADAVRSSIDGTLKTKGSIVPFDVGYAYALLRAISGPAYDTLLKQKALVVDSGGPLENVPAGVLVATYDPTKASQAATWDYSKVDFLAARQTISTAISPRSFLVSRALPQSTAPQPFLGLGSPQPPSGGGGQRPINVGFACVIPYSQVAALSRSLKPINSEQLAIAANGLGVPNAPMITAAAFSDTALTQRTDLANFQVLHFATHGLPEGVWGCAQSPPALVTSFGNEESDGLLSFSEVAGLRLNANLVVLSACETASGVQNEELARESGQEQVGQTLEGLVRAFLAANARAVLATYWQVSTEKQSDELMRAFYTSARTASIGKALQDAQLLLMRDPQYSHPFYWAPYFVVGDSTKSMLSAPAPQPQQVAAR
jgi:CHAT domain-containing protein/tetratricopeptide (TPR) repeat protein